MIHEKTSTLDSTVGHEMATSTQQVPVISSSSGSGKSRRMKLLERQGCFRNGTKTVTVQRATTVEDLYAAYQLVYLCFVEKGYIFPNPSRLRMRPYEALPETATFVAKADNNVVGVTSIVVDTPGLGLPSEKPYPREVESLRQSAQKLCEITNLAIAPDFRRTNILTELIRCYIAHFLAIGCDYAIASISPGHLAFYELLGFELVGARTSYSQDFDDPVILVQLSLDDLMERFEQVQVGDEDDWAVLKNYYMDSSPYHSQMARWSDDARNSFADPVFLRRLFVENSNLLRDCTSSELDVIRGYWGEDLFLNALGHTILYDGFLPCEL
jgi:hypothetical protein